MPESGRQGMLLSCRAVTYTAMGSPERKRLGLIGFGQFGQFAARHLREQFEVVVTDERDLEAAAGEVGVRWASLAEVASSPYLALAVPVQAMPGVVEQVSDHVKPGSLVFDVGSVKVFPVEQMLAGLPAEVEVLGSHPLFGPQSAATGLAGKRIVLCPVRTRRLDKVRDFLTEAYGLEVLVCDPDAHDRQIATTQGLAQFIGRALAALQESESPVRTPGYEQLRAVARTVGEDSWELFRAIQNLNPHCESIREELLERLQELHHRLAED